MKETWGIDLDKLREAVLRRQTEVERLDLTLPEDASNETTNSNAE